MKKIKTYANLSLFYKVHGTPHLRSIVYGPRHEKTCIRSLQPGDVQASLLSEYRDQLKYLNLLLLYLII